MNNQAAQTMPSWVQERELIRAALCKELDTNIESDERTYTIAVRAANALHWRQIEIDQLKAQVAALSQTAGVAEGWKLVPVDLRTADAVWEAGIKARNSNGTVLAIWNAMLAAAPAASGGESHPDALPDGTLSKSTAKRVEALSSNPNPVTPGLSSESGVSVIKWVASAWPSDKIRLMLHEVIAMGTRHEAALAIAEQAIKEAVIRRMAEENDALEQALTQQRGECESASLKEIVPAEKRNYLDDNGNPRSIEDEAYAHGWNACRSATLKKMELTTPQPGAEALREYIVELRGRADKHELNGLHACSVGMKDAADRHDEKAKLQRAIADELESLLARGA